MSDEPTLDAAEISRRIVVGVGLVYDLLNELNGLLRMILDGLRSSEMEFEVIMSKFFRMPVPRGRASTPADKALPLDRGFVLNLGVSGDEEDDEGEDEGDDADEGESASEKRGLKITPESHFLALRVVLYDRNQAKGNEFVPAVVAATLADMKQIPKGKAAQKKKTMTTFQVRQGRVLQLAKGLGPSVATGQALSFRAGGHELVCAVNTVVSRPLAEFDSEKSVNAFVEELVQMAEGATN